MATAPFPKGSMDVEENAEDSGQETALLPKSIFPDKDLEPGKVCKFRVVATYEDEVEVEYVRSEKDSGDSDEIKEYSAEEQIDRMAMPGMERM